MRVLKIVGIVVAVLAGICLLLVLAGFLIDPDVRLETEATLSAPPEVVFEVLHSHEGQIAWWDRAMEQYVSDGEMPPMEVEHTGGPARGKDMQIAFTSEGEVFEEWKVLDATAPDRIVYEVDFQIFVVERTLTLTPSGGGTHVSWVETAHLSNPVMRYMTFMPEQSIIENFDAALAALDEVSSGVDD